MTRARKMPGVTIDTLRSFALSLPETSEAPHFEATSFRVRGKIFVTIPAGELVAHVFVDETETAAALERQPSVYETLIWGNKQWGVRATLANALEDDLFELVEDAWYRKAPARVRALHRTKHVR